MTPTIIGGLMVWIGGALIGLSVGPRVRNLLAGMCALLLIYVGGLIQAFGN